MPATIVTRTGKGSPLTTIELDANITNLNTVKMEDVDTRANTRPSLLLAFDKTKKLDPRITFTRASTGTYYDGKTTALAEQNLFTYSQDFTNAYWKAFSAVTATGNAIAAPDGTVTATQIAANAASTNNGSFESTIGASIGSTITVYAKAGNVNYLAIGSANANAWASFNLSTGAPGNSFACTTSMVPVGGGWYRCVMANITSALTRVLFAMKSTDVTADPWGNGTVAIGDYIYVWGAQLEQRSSPTTYFLTGATANTNYIPVIQTAANNIARFDNDPVTGESKGLLVEESRTNTITYSQSFLSSIWTLNNSSTTTYLNSTIAPDGTMNGHKIVALVSASNVNHLISYGLGNLTRTPGTYTFSFYAKAGEVSKAVFSTNIWINGGSVYAMFDLINLITGGLTAGVTATITSVGNGWCRCTATYTSSVTNSGSYAFGPSINLADGQQGNFAGDGYSGIYVWGAQEETGAFATSYIPTTTAQVTRAADFASMTGTNFSSWYRQDEGTLYGELNFIGQTASGWAYPISVNDGNIYNTIAIRRYYTLPVVFRLDIASGVIKSVTSTQSNNNIGIKIAGGYKTLNFGASFDGSVVTSDTTVITSPIVNRLDIGHASGSSNYFTGYIKRIAYYPKRLSNTELQSITTT